jgi:HD superfamily phosphohydrolase
MCVTYFYSSFFPEYIELDRVKAGRATDLNIGRIIRSARVLGDRITYGDKVAPDIHALFMHRRHNGSEIYMARTTQAAAAIVIDVCQILAQVYEWEKLCQDEDSFDWRIVLTDSALTSLPMIVHTPVLMKGLSEDNQALLKTAYTLYTRLQRRQWYPQVKDDLDDTDESRRESMDPLYTVSVASALDYCDERKNSAQTISAPNNSNLFIPSLARSISDPPQLYPASYAHKFRNIRGVSSDCKFNPLKRIRCYTKVENKYLVRPLLTVLHEKSGKNPLYEKRITVISRD